MTAPLTHSQETALLCLAEEGSQHSFGFVNRSMASLEKRGLVEGDDARGRRRNYTITQAGRDERERIRAARAKAAA
jgi:predicted transcriptional regulator